MIDPPDDDALAATPDEVEAALRAFQAGAPAAFDRLVSDEADGPPVCEMLAGLSASPGPPTPAELISDDYEVITEIARGGMGVIYSARQVRTRRVVALKVMQHRASSDDYERRMFRREVDALARLKHPTIAQLHDAGQTPTGRPYFAMEMVAGRPLSDYRVGGGTAAAAVRDARDRLPRLSVPEALALFCKICEGISYAHQRGVIHRDLKPGNILVVEDGGAPFPKILDFGLATLLNTDATVTLAAEGGRIVGTLAYMSPEQALGRPEELDIRSDVYSLGVMLYEMLAGRRPYDVRTSSWPEAVRNICESPAQPLGAMDPTLRGDLETIVLKALSKDRNDRYQSAAALSDDLGRYLANQPILSRPPSAVYVLRKLIARHRLPVAMLTLVFALTVAFAVVFGVQRMQLARERDQARTSAERAQRISAYLSGMFASMDPRSTGTSLSLREVLNRAAASMDEELAGDLATRAAIHGTMGKSYLAIRDRPAAERHLAAALELSRKAFGDEQPAVAAAMHQLGVCLVRGHRFDDGGKLLNDAHQLRLRLHGPEHLDVAESLTGLAELALAQENFAEAERRHRDALAMRRALAGRDLSVAESLDGLSVVLVAAGRYEEAEPLLVEALAIRRAQLGENHYDVARTLTELGEIHTYWGHHEDAEAVYREQVRAYRRIFPDGHKDLAVALSDLAATLAARGTFEEADGLFKESVDMEARVSGEHDNGLTLNNYAAFLREQGRYREAEQAARRVYIIWNGDSPTPHRAQGYACQNLANVLLDLGRHDEALKLFDAAERAWRTQFGTIHPKLAVALIGQGRIAEMRADLPRAERLYREALQIRRERIGMRNPETAVAMIHVARVLMARGDMAGRPLLAEALGVLRDECGPRHPHLAWGLCQAAAMSGDGAAEAMLREAIDIERALSREEHPNLARCLVGLAAILRQRSDDAGAAHLLREALTIQEKRLFEGDAELAATRQALAACAERSPSETDRPPGGR